MECILVSMSLTAMAYLEAINLFVSMYYGIMKLGTNSFSEYRDKEFKDPKVYTFYLPFGCHISDINRILGGRWGYSLGNSK